MNVVITMAGKGQRFIDAGYTQPKYMIEVKGKTLFEWSMLSLRQLNAYKPLYIFIVKKEDHASFFIQSQCNKLSIHKIQIIEIDEQTDGQATTALLAQSCWREYESLFIYNIDTYVVPPKIDPKFFKGNGYIPCFNAEGDHWSFVKTDNNNKAIEVKEKRRISDNCTIGAYYFNTANLYKTLYYDYYANGHHLVNGEKYIAPLYNQLIQTDGDVYVHCIQHKYVHVLGTPEEVEEFRKSVYVNKV